MRVSLQHKTKPSKGLHPGLAWLLRNCEYEDNDAKMGRMAAKKVPMLYLETMETPKNKSEEFNETRDASVAGSPERKHSEGILGNCGERHSPTHYHKRKTRTGRILQHP